MSDLPSIYTIKFRSVSEWVSDANVWRTEVCVGWLAGGRGWSGRARALAARQLAMHGGHDRRAGAAQKITTACVRTVTDIQWYDSLLSSGSNLSSTLLLVSQLVALVAK